MSFFHLVIWTLPPDYPRLPLAEPLTGPTPYAIPLPSVARRMEDCLGRVDELFDDYPCRNQMNQSQKGLAQFLIPCRNAAKLFELVEESFHLLA